MHDALPSLRKNLSNAMPIELDEAYFFALSEHADGSQTPIAADLYFGKTLHDSDRVLSGIAPAVEPIRDFVVSRKVDLIAFVPSTNPRPFDFSDLLRDSLALDVPELPVSKVVPAGAVPVEQKSLKWPDRVRNALDAIHVSFPAHQASCPVPDSTLAPYGHALILDDNFTSGATFNAIAHKIRALGFPGRISAIAITGRLSYDPDYVDPLEV